MKQLGRYALLVGVLAILFSACLPVRTIQEKVSGVDDGTTRIGPNWPITFSIPMLKGAMIDVGDSFDGFEGVIFEESLVTFEQSLGERTIDIGLERKEIEVVLPDPSNPAPLPKNEFFTSINIDNIVTAQLDSGFIRVELQGLQPPIGEKVIISLKKDNEHGDVITTAEISPGQYFADLSLSDIELTGQMVLTADGNLEYVDAYQGSIVIESFGPFELKEIVLPPDQLHARFDAVIINESETINIADGVQIDNINLSLDLDITYDNFTAENLEMSLLVNLTGYDQNGAMIDGFNTTTLLQEGTVPLNDLTRDLKSLITNPKVKEIELYFDQVSIEPADPLDPVTLRFSAEPTISAEATIAFDAPGENDGDPIRFNTTFDTPKDFPDEIAGGALIITVNNDSPLQGTFEIWFSETSVPQVTGAPNIFLQFNPFDANQKLEASLSEDIIDLFRTQEEVRITIQLSELSAKEAVEKDDVMIIDAYGIIAGRMNNS